MANSQYAVRFYSIFQIHNVNITILSSMYEVILYRKELGNLTRAADSSNVT